LLGKVRPKRHAPPAEGLESSQRSSVRSTTPSGTQQALRSHHSSLGKGVFVVPNFLIELSLCKDLGDFCAKVGKTDKTATRGSRTTLWYQGNPNYVGDGTLTGSSTPSTAFYDGTASGISLTGFSAEGSTMTCTVAGGVPQPTPTTVPTATPAPTVAPTATPSPGGSSGSSGGGCVGGATPWTLVLFLPLLGTVRRK